MSHPILFAKLFFNPFDSFPRAISELNIRWQQRKGIVSGSEPVNHLY